MQSESNDNWIIFFWHTKFIFRAFRHNWKFTQKHFRFRFESCDRFRSAQSIFFFIHSLHRFIDSKSIFFADERFLSMKTSLIDSKIELSYSAKNVRNWLNSDLKFEISLIVFVDLLTIFEFEVFEEFFSESTELIDLAIFLSVKGKSLFLLKSSKIRTSVFDSYFVCRFYSLLWKSLTEWNQN